MRTVQKFNGPKMVVRVCWGNTIIECSVGAGAPPHHETLRPSKNYFTEGMQTTEAIVGTQKY